MPDNLKNTPMADTMEFIETPTFTRQILALLPDDDYRGLQNELMEDPERGDIIKGGGGVRKVRYAAKGHGKRGGNVDFVFPLLPGRKPGGVRHCRHGHRRRGGSGPLRRQIQA